MAVTMELTWGGTAASVYAGKTVSVPVSDDPSYGINFSPNAEIVSYSSGAVVIRGLEPGTKTIPADTHWTDTRSGHTEDWSTNNSFTLTVLPDDPKVATESQWADLVSRIKALDARITARENA